MTPRPLNRINSWKVRTILAVAMTLLITPLGMSAAQAVPTPPWSAPQTISTGTSRSYDPISTAVTPDGSKQIIFWESIDSGVKTVKSASATLSGNVALWGPTSTVATLNDDSSRPSIALSWDGTRATAVWQDTSGANQLIKSASATISGTTQTWGSAATVHSAFNAVVEVPRVALAAGGDLAMVAWYAFDGGSYKIMTRAAGVVGTDQYWQASAEIFTPVSSGWNAYLPAIAMNDDATKATVAYHNYNADFTEGAVYSRSATITPGTSPTPPTVSWGTAQFLNIPGAGGKADNVDVALSGDGSKAIASWTNFGTPNVVQINTATISGNAATWSNSGGTTLSDSTRAGFNSQVSMSNDGLRAVAVWSQQTGTNTYVTQVRSATVSGTTSTWAAATSLSPSSGNASTPDIALSNSGLLATAVWAYSTGAPGSHSLHVIQASNGYSNGTIMTWSPSVTISPETATPLSNPPEGYGYGGAKPQVALSTDGLIAATAWDWASGSSFSVQTVKANGTCTETWDGSTQCLPGAPTSVSATAGDGTATLSWTAPTDPYGYGITGYAYELVDASTSTVVRPLTSTGTTATNLSISGLTNGTTYIANISTINNFGLSATDASSSSFTPTAAPVTPTNPGTSTPTQQTTSTSPASVTPTVTPTVIAGRPDNPTKAEAVAPGFKVVSAAVADNTPPRVMKREPGATLKDAPIINGTEGRPVSLVTQGLSANTNYLVRVKINKKYVDLGGALSDAQGRAQLPVFQSTRPGTFTLGLTDPVSGQTSYIKVRIA